MYNGYTAYFGLNDIPFSIAPNPHFLFMSGRHKEALAHLTYGLGEAGGFVLLTGEVGTGKTTVSKCLLEQLPENTQAAFILNPTLSARELLATVCDELGILYDQKTATLKTFTDYLLQYLLSNHHKGKNTLLIIDEAQHLQPEVLEQLRLLTNLETHTKKLLQVILIGQPELQELLKRRDLRQLAQRITARYHLLPLNKAEVEQYIKHRLSVAGCHKPLFKDNAITLIHKLSGGVPRLINLLCDRALLGAFGNEQHQVDKALIVKASKEALNIDANKTGFLSKPVFKNVAAVLAILLIGTSGFYYAQQQRQQLLIEEQAVAQRNSARIQQLKQQQLHNIPNALINQSRTLSSAFSTLFLAWQIQLPNDDTQPCTKALDYQLQCYWFKGDLDRLLALGYPAVVQLTDNNQQHYYGTVLAVHDKQLQIVFSGQTHWLSKQFFAQHYQGSAAIIWRSPKGFVDKISANSTIELVQWLENKLSAQQQRNARKLMKFDPLLANQLGQYQQQLGLKITEMGDTETVMSFANEVNLRTVNQSITSIEGSE